MYDPLIVEEPARKPATPSGVKAGLADTESLAEGRYVVGGVRRQDARPMKRQGKFTDDAAFTDSLGNGRGRGRW